MCRVFFLTEGMSAYTKYIEVSYEWFGLLMTKIHKNVVLF